MSGKRNFILSFFLTIAIVTMMTFSLTYARYSGEVESGSEISGDLEYIVSNEIKVTNVEEFLSAIENGYNNIQIDDSVDNPLIITGSTSDVNSDLTIDLNGHDLQRNNRDPLLNVTEGVRLTIIDSKGGGSFYNPVGSVLRISGGTLTIADGIFESGPRNGFEGSGVRFDSEYYNASANSTETGASLGEVQNVTYWDQATDGYGDDTKGETQRMPVIQPKITPEVYVGADGVERERNRVDGSMYFESAPSVTGEYHDLTDDTYLYYTVEGVGVSNTVNMAQSDKNADFYYRYYVHNVPGADNYFQYAEDDFQTILDNMENYAQVTVYGYHTVKEMSDTAASVEGKPYAAIQMESGNLYVRGGRYTSYFGKGNTYCVQATGGYMAVDHGGFEAMEQGVCVDIDYDRIDDSEYLNVTYGEFYSECGDTVRVSGGRMTVGGGFFQKTAPTGGDTDTDNGSAIHMVSGELTVGGVSPVSFNLVGDHIDGIRSEGGSIDCTNLTITGGGSHMRGIAAVSSDTSAAAREDSVTITDLEMELTAPGGDWDDVFGVYAETDVSLNGKCSVTVYGTYSSGIYVKGGGLTYQAGNSDGMDVTMKMPSGNDTLSSTAVSAVEGSISLLGEVTILSDGIGVTTSTGTDGSTQGGTANFTFGNQANAGDTLSVTSTRGMAMYIDGSATLYGTAEVSSTVESTANVPAGEGQIPLLNGVHLQTGSLTTHGSFTVTHTGYGAAVYIKEGGFTAESAVEIKNDNSKCTDTSGVSFDGVYVGGSLTAKDAFNVTHTGIESSGTGTYQKYQIRSFAVRVEGGTGSTGSTGSTVTIPKGEIVANVGGGIYVNGGTVTLGTEGENDLTVTVHAYTDVANRKTEFGKTVQDGNYSSHGVANWRYKLNKTGGAAVEVNGGSLTIYGGTYTTQQGDGILVRNFDGSDKDKTIIKGGKFIGKDNYNPDGTEMRFAGPAASYAFRMLGGTAVIEGGEFGETVKDAGRDKNIPASGIFVMGPAGGTANLTITNATVNVSGQAGISIYQNANVTLNSGVTASGYAAGIAIETNYESGASASAVTIKGGNYTGTEAETAADGVWYGNGQVTLNIDGGTFTGITRSGLYFEAQPSAAVQLSGGTFNGVEAERTRRPLYGIDYYYNGGGISSNTSDEWNWVYYEYTGVQIDVENIIPEGYIVSQNNSRSGTVHEDLAGHTTIEIKKAG